MAEEGLALREQLVAEATCPLCLDLFEQPVLTACGHSFCRQCLAGVLGDPPRPAACPQCRAPVEPGSLRPNRSLGNMAGLARSLEEVAARPRCPQHGRTLALFCAPCAALLCALCRDEPEHRRHYVRPAEEAARELRMTVMWELQHVPETFEELQRCMEEQKKILLAQLEQMFQELVNKSEEYKCRVLERKSLLDTVIAQIQEKRDQPAVEFLMDVGRILNSYEAAKGPIPEPVSPGMQKRIERLSEKRQQVVDMVAKFKVNLQCQICLEREQVRLDPETAHPWLLLSDDRKTVQFGDGKQNLPDTPKRFTSSFSVLGSQGFTSGRHYWEVEVGEGVCWAVGVALKSVLRKEPLGLLRSEKIWALQLELNGQYRAERISPYPLALREKLQRIRVHLDYEAGRVTFYNTKDMRLILQFEATFTEKVFPYFWVYSAKTKIWVCD